MSAAVDRFWRSADGLTLHATDYAAAPGEARLPVVCLHGLTRNGRDFDRLAPWLAARGRRVLALDIRGRGRSDRDPAADYRLPTYAADVTALLSALGIGRALFVGTSMGGLITMEVAALAPGVIAGAVVNDIGPEIAATGLARIAAYAGTPATLADWAAAAEHVRRQNKVALPHYAAADWDAMARRMFREADDGIVADYDRAIARTLDKGGLGGDPWARWEGLADGRPILLLRGGTSDLLDADVAARMAARGGVRLATVPDVGHAPMLDEPVALSAIEAFIADAP